MTSGLIVAAILEKENAVKSFRDLIGSTDPAEAADGTIRKKYAKVKLKMQFTDLIQMKTLQLKVISFFKEEIH